MPVVFTSRGYDTTPAKPYTEDAWANAFGDSFIGASKYGVNGAGDWKVSIVANATRTVSIAAGKGWGCGVTDETTQNETLQFAPSASGARWDTVAVRRDWNPTAGVSQFVIIQGGSSRAISGSRLFGPGDIDDQPIALVQIKENQTQPEAVVDLRCWAANGGVIIRDDAARSYLARLGAEVRLGSVTWFYGMDGNGTPAWSSDAPDQKPVALSGGYAPLAAGYAAPNTRKHSDGRIYFGGAIGASGATVNVDKKIPDGRFKIGEVDPSHRPATLEAFEPIATTSLGRVFVYVYPAGHPSKAGHIEFEASNTGVIPKDKFWIILTGGLSWAAA
ncbi:hypothetical protein RI444_15475 [Paenarthrobacter sp. AT5]|uniref:hypothetical protein n=1 Tax=Paenarthrobacter TaxID=1742992 RepID=UPI001A98307F|nr:MULTISPECIES: hypothetical protein [Paenarthrobacter]QSZ53267.1 hypothetical protein AYX19_09795 [Paenarthrobacter ureafaciens]WOC59908.1 hypothetical protein RI444_15475 [Paenarthrobacter sp. AT5]